MPETDTIKESCEVRSDRCAALAALEAFMVVWLEWEKGGRIRGTERKRRRQVLARAMMKLMREIR